MHFHNTAWYCLIIFCLGVWRSPSWQITAVKDSRQYMSWTTSESHFLYSGQRTRLMEDGGSRDSKLHVISALKGIIHLWTFIFGGGAWMATDFSSSGFTGGQKAKGHSDDPNTDGGRTSKKRPSWEEERLSKQENGRKSWTRGTGKTYVDRLL